MTGGDEGELTAERILASMPVGYIAWDSLWRCTSLNEIGSRLAGYTAEAALGRFYWDLFPDMVGTDLEASYLRVARTAVPETVEIFYPEPLNTWFDTRVSGDAEGVSAFFFDTNARHRIQDELAQAAERSKVTALALSEALARTEEASRRVTGMAEVAVALTSAASVRELEEIVVGRGLPVLGAEGGAVVSAAPDGSWRITVNAALGDHVQVIYGNLPYDSPLPACWTARTGQRLLLPDRAAGLEFHPDMASVYTDTQRDAWAFLPLISGGRRLGALAVSWIEERHLDAEELDLLDGFGAQCAQALLKIETLDAQRSAALEMQQLAESLQQALLTPPPEPDHLHIAVRYRPAGHHAQVGGDWYDAFLQPDGTTMLVIGDVVGHDSDAAGKMGQLRGVLRTLAYDAARVDALDTPSTILTRVEHAARGLSVDTLATAILARIERGPTSGGHRRLRWANAGHPPPLLIYADGTVEVLESKPDLLLGVNPDAERHDHVADLPDEATLVFYTDGLVERRDASREISTEALRDVVAELASMEVEEFCDTLLARLAPDVDEDDTALLVVRAHSEKRPRPPSAGPERIPPLPNVGKHPATPSGANRDEPASVRTVLELPFGLDAPSLARRFVTEYASSLPAPLRDDAELIVSELVTNAIRWGQPSITLQVDFDPPRLAVSVTDEGEGLPILPDGRPDLTAPSGRGLMIIAAVAHKWGVTPLADRSGKTVWFELHDKPS